MASKLPAELLQHVYTYLSPSELQAVRQTYPLWRSAARCNQTMRLLAERSGWSSSLPTEGKLSNQQLAEAEKLLETESNILNACTSDSPTGENNHRRLFQQISRLDLTPLSDDKEKVSATSTFSVDTDYLLVCRGATVYVYHVEINSPESFLTPLAAIKCPRRVLQATMDVSGNRHSVAALQEGRVACICNLEDELAISPTPITRSSSDAPSLHAGEESNVANRKGRLT